MLLVGGYLIYDHNEKSKIKKQESAKKLERLNNDINEITRHTEWLKRNLDFENEMRSILRRTGYTLEQANDSLIVDQDKIYLNGELKDTEQAEWYKAHRKDLLNFPSEYYKQFPKEKH